MSGFTVHVESATGRPITRSVTEMALKSAENHNLSFADLLRVFMVSTELISEQSRFRGSSGVTLRLEYHP